MIRLLIALHPRSWREQYGDEFRALLEAAPMNASIVVDVLRNAGRQHVRAHPSVLRIALALASSIVIEVATLRLGLTDNILWLPTTPTHTIALTALLLPWVPMASDILEAARRSRQGRRATQP